MNRDTLKGDWMTFKGKVKEKWGQLTDDDVDVVEGQLEQLAGAITRRYGLAKDEAHRELDRLYRELHPSR